MRCAGTPLLGSRAETPLLTLLFARGLVLSAPCPRLPLSAAAILLKAAKGFQGSFQKLSTWNTSNPCGLWAGIICNYGTPGTVSVV